MSSASTLIETASRTTCLRCRRPRSHCWCALVPSLSPKTRVVIVQHPRERFVPIGTARMAHLALAGSRLVDACGADVDGHPAMHDVLADPGAAVLFPGEGTRDVSDPRTPRPATLVVVDGTWSQARALLRLNPRLASLPRVSFSPAAPGNYRIRKEPAAHCLATVEAVAGVLAVLEGDDAYAQLLAPFTWMVDRQLEAASSTGRHRTRTKPKPRSFDVPDLSRAVLVYAEANAHPRHCRAPGAPELLHLVASSTKGRFEARLRPRRPLPAEVEARLGLPRDALVEEPAEALARFRAYVAGAPLALWGPYARDLLVAEGEPSFGFVDLRQLAARALGRSPGGIDGAARAFAVPVAPTGGRLSGRGPASGLAGAGEGLATAPPAIDDAASRAHRMLAAVEGIAAALTG